MQRSNPLAGKRVLITGANAGIGRATAENLAAKGMEVILACRDSKKGEKAAELIRQKTSNPSVRNITCDLNSLSSVRQAAQEIANQWDRLDVLINNAGIFTTRLQHTEEGFEKQFGVNHLGHFLLTQLLLDRLQNSPTARIINVSSVAHYKGRIDWKDLKGEKGSKCYKTLSAYAQSKLCNVLFTKELARRYDKITANCLHPGVVRTYLANKDVSWYFQLLWSMWKPFMHSSKRGACTSIYLASSPEVRDVSGRYFDDRQCPRKPSALARDEKLGRCLWDYSLEACKDYLS